jgi:RNA recognition motif-containing protein
MQVSIKINNRTTIFDVASDFDVEDFLKTTDEYIKTVSNPSPGLVPSSTLYVGNLDSSINERYLKNIFGRYGRVSLVNVNSNIHTKTLFAFVKYEDIRDAKDAQKEENGRYFKGKRIPVEFSKNTAIKSKKNTRCKSVNLEDKFLLTPKGKNALDCTLDELVKYNMTRLEIKKCEIEDWVSVHGDCEYPY